MVFCDGTYCDALFELRNGSEYDEIGNKSEKAEGLTVRLVTQWFPHIPKNRPQPRHVFIGQGRA